MKNMIKVSQQGNGDFRTIQAAINSIPNHSTEEIMVTIESGVYKEKLKINKPNLHLFGEGDVKITFDDYSPKLNQLGVPMGTFASSSTYITADNIKVHNITFENSAGESDKVAQAVALYVDADKVSFKNCTFISAQDTLYLGRPKEELSNISGRNYFENCRIVGDIDFIFGSATAFFHKCEIVSIDQGKKINGYITAAATPMDKEIGFVFHRCKLISEADKNTVFLGRPWRDYARTVFIDCWMDKHIHQEGWNDWDKVSAETTVYYGELGSVGPGASSTTRVAWAQQLDDKDFVNDKNICWRGFT
ncbi:pectinesterase family protein [Paenibacillus sp. FA6]|uniref:pectinesterase family protein n=1 Tax=Paenibacillus sp. FA6 TaxID=3413029 RepID=UPI003F65E8D3